MVSYTSTKEKDFERLIEKALSGVESNRLAEPTGGYNDVHNGFAVGLRQVPFSQKTTATAIFRKPYSGLF